LTALVKHLVLDVAPVKRLTEKVVSRMIYMCRGMLNPYELNLRCEPCPAVMQFSGRFHCYLLCLTGEG